ncbi:MAG TPA: UPF0175 family protein [Thermomicrobiaceae bacterium]|nr:UPF0175 family protein [Thermomicrobiaceae bacterium]
MSTRILSLELPEELLLLLGSDEVATAKAKEALVLELLREARISQGQAARLLGVTRRDILALAARYHISSGPATPNELSEELDRMQRAPQEP